MNLNRFLEFTVWDKNWNGERLISVHPDSIEWFQPSSLKEDMTEMSLTGGEILLITKKYELVRDTLDGLMERVRGF